MRRADARSPLRARAQVSTAYSLGKLQPRGELFVDPGVEVYPGMIIGEHSRENDLEVAPGFLLAPMLFFLFSARVLNGRPACLNRAWGGGQERGFRPFGPILGHPKHPSLRSSFGGGR